MDKKLLDTIFKAVGLAMGVSAFVITILQASSLESTVKLLSIGVICLGIATFNSK